LNPSGKEFHIAYFSQNQQAFLEAHVKAFEYFGGIFKAIRYDNLTSAVKKVLHGRKRLETEQFTLLKSHYLFETIFCMPGKEGAHEKGGVEGGVGRFRRNHLTPVLKVSSILELNTILLQACAKDDKRRIIGKAKPIEILWQEEIALLLPLAKKAFCCEEVLNVRVNNKGLVSIKSNLYSLPINLVGHMIEARLRSNTIIMFCKGKLSAQHERLVGKGQITVELEHYLPLLYRKPGAFASSLALHQAKLRNRWPNIFNEYWNKLIKKHDEYSGTQEFIGILILLKNYKLEILQAIMEKALESGSFDLASVIMLLRYFEKPELQPEYFNEEEIKGLSQYNRDLPDVSDFNLLLN